MGKHEEHICRFNDGECSCECYDIGFEAGRKEGTKEIREKVEDWLTIAPQYRTNEKLLEAISSHKIK